MARALGGSGAASLGALGRTTNWLHAIGNQINTNFASGGLPAIATLGTQSGINATGLFPQGANPPDGIANNSGVGRAHIFFPPGLLIRDQYCAQTMRVDLIRPLVRRVDPFAVWEVECDLIMRLPSGAIANDLGLVLHADTATTGHGTDFTNSAVAALTGTGIALMATGADNQIRCLARRSGAGFSVNIATGIIAQAPGAAVDRFRRLKIRLESATVSADAKCTWFVDDVPVATRNLTAAAGMPDATLIPSAGAFQWNGAFRAFIRQGGNNVSGAVLAYSHWRVSSAPSVAAMGS